MTSEERKEIRYQRRKAKRDRKVLERSRKYGNLEQAFCFHKVMYYGDKCTKGVGFKKSTQYFKLHMFTIVATTCKNIKSNCYKVGNTYQFTIHERGKVRIIDAPHIKDRLVHKVIANEILSPIYYPHFIYDNGASIRNKGFHFAMKRVHTKLYSWYLKNGLEGYAVTIDFFLFFFFFSHEAIKKIHTKYIFNSHTIKVIEDYLFIKEGLPLGCEIAQKEALMLPNQLDHFIANQYPIVRFMDDSIFLINTKEEGKIILNHYQKLAEKLGIIMNLKKTKIIRIEKFILFCKWNYVVLNSGKVLMIPVRDTIYRQRTKINKMKQKSIDKIEILQTKTCFQSYLDLGNTYYHQKYLNQLLSK